MAPPGSSPSGAERASAASEAATDAGPVRCGVVADAAELAAHRAIRREVFVALQGLFDVDDGDERDHDAGTLHVVGRRGEAVVGAVRLYRLDPGRPDGWKGDRLAVLPGARAGHVGAALVRCAVALASARDGRRMVALVQAQNVAFFRRLGWTDDGPRFHHRGVPHQPMAITLGAHRLGPGA